MTDAWREGCTGRKRKRKSSGAGAASSKSKSQEAGSSTDEELVWNSETGMWES